MSLASVLSVEIDSGRMLEYVEATATLATKARKQKDDFTWTAHQAVFGGVSTLHFASECEGFKALSERGLAPEMIVRVLGEKAGAEAMRLFGSATRNLSTSISRDRPELSYSRDEGASIAPVSVLTMIRARPGQLEACEELIRKIAEAIPKVGDPARMTAFQTVIGDLAQFWTARPLDDLADLDDQLQPQELLNQAFGAAEGGLIYRTGLNAIESTERSILIYREELSNPAV